MEEMESSSKKAELKSEKMQELLELLKKESSDNNPVAVLLDTKVKPEPAQKLDLSVISDVFSKIRKTSLKSELSPLHVAAYVGNESVCQVLLDQRNVKVHIVDEYGQTPLHYATAQGKVDVVKRLRFHHADVYFRNKDGVTSVDLAEGEDVKETLVGPRFGGDEVEDEFLQEKLPLLVERIVQTGKNEDYEMMLELCYCLRGEIRSATSSLTSVPKPLKILGASYGDLKSLYQELESQHPSVASSVEGTTLATIISVLSMSKKDRDKERDCITYCTAFLKVQLEQKDQQQSTLDPLQSFGDPYVRHLCMQFPEEYQQLDPTTGSCVERHAILIHLRNELIGYLLKRNAEPEVVDLLMEIEDVRDVKEDLRKLEGGDQSMSEVLHHHLRAVVGDRKAQILVNNRICQYLVSCVKYVQEPMNSRLLETAFDLHMTYESYPQAILVAMQLNDGGLIKRVFLTCPDRIVRKQLAFVLGRQQVFLDLDEEPDLEDNEELKEIISNVLLNNNFLNLARELDIVEPKEPEHIYKTHLENARFSSVNNVDSAKQNLASSFVNGFVNCAFGKDNIMTEDGNKWIYKHKPTGMLSATASLGLILLWDVDAGLTEIDKFLYANDDNIKAGALLACGVVNSGVRNECDPALALLSDYVQNKSNVIRSGAILGLGLSYAGSNREEVLDVLTPSLTEMDPTPETVGLTAMSCGLVAIGSCNDVLADSLIQLMMETEEEELNNTYMRLVALGLALLYLGKQDKAEVVMETLKAVKEPLSGIASILLDICAYAGTGDVLKVQKLLHICSEHFAEKEPKEVPEDKDKEKKEDPKPEPGSLKEPGAHQAFAVLGLALISLGEGIGAEMALRMCNHFLQYGEAPIRRAVPLALCLISVSNPELSIMDTLSKFSHDNDPEVAYNAIFAMGIIGAGTNNARLGGLLRQLAQFYCKDASSLFMVRLAQGLVHLGKGTLTLNPYHSDRQLMSPVATGGLLAVLVSFLDCKNLILTSSPHLLYYLVPAIQPRMLVTFDEELKPLTVTVRVGQAVDTVAQAGHQKGITGFQTHTTPVLLAYGERAELATEEYLPLSPVLEGFVILRKNPDYEEQ